MEASSRRGPVASFLATLHKEHGKRVLAFLTCVVAVAGQHVNTGSGGQMHIELWQAIYLVGAPILALMFARPVIDDLKDWWAARRATHRE
jgi:hypothetical protein